MPADDSSVQESTSRTRPAYGLLEVIPGVQSAALGNARDITVCLPASYYRSEARYPVIYMHDGQNLFDPATSFAGEWGADAALATAPRGGRRAILVGIPNAATRRIHEYSPFVDEGAGGGLGEPYLDFLLGTVKPLIDERYHTIPVAHSTGIVGSSMGGLISLYAFFRHPGSFGFAGVMSPALWFAEGAIFPFVEQADYTGGRIWLDVGTEEGERALSDARRMRDLLLEKGMRRGRDLAWVEERGGAHEEAAWGRRLRTALPFLLDGGGG